MPRSRQELAVSAFYLISILGGFLYVIFGR